MGEVVALIRVMPKEILDERKMENLKSRIREKIKDPARLERMEVKDIAFGIKSINVTIVVPDAAGGADQVAEELSNLEEVESAEVIDVGRI